jgi:PKD repeat protein
MKKYLVIRMLLIVILLIFVQHVKSQIYGSCNINSYTNDVILVGYYDEMIRYNCWTDQECQEIESLATGYSVKVYIDDVLSYWEVYDNIQQWNLKNYLEDLNDYHPCDYNYDVKLYINNVENQSLLAILNINYAISGTSSVEFTGNTGLICEPSIINHEPIIDIECYDSWIISKTTSGDVNYFDLNWHNNSSFTVTPVNIPDGETKNFSVKVNYDNNFNAIYDEEQIYNFEAMGKPVGSCIIEGEQNISIFYNEYSYNIIYEEGYDYVLELNDINAAKNYTVINDNEIKIEWDETYIGTPIIRARAQNDCGEYTEWVEYPIILENFPEKAITPNGNTNLCQNGSEETYTTFSNYADSYEWELGNSSAGSLMGSGTSAILYINDSWSGTTSIKVRGVNEYGYGQWSDELNININSLPTKAAKPTGIINLCQNNSNESYTTSGASNATSYEWDISPSAAGSISGIGTTGTVDWSSDFSGFAYVKVRGINSCGEGVYSDQLNVTVNPLPLKPSVPDGNIEVCQQGTNTYEVIDSDIFATSYHWEISPSEAGTIRKNGEQTVTIDWASNYSGNLQVRVKGINDCGSGFWSMPLNIYMNELPGEAGKPLGQVSPCQGGIYNYSTSGALNATSYEYVIIPSEAGILNVNGSDCEIIFNSSYSGGASIRVRGINECGNGIYSDDLNIDIQPLPLKAGKPSGSIEICQNIETSVYSTSGAIYAENDLYDWDLFPSEAGSIVGNTKDATVYWSSNFVGQAKIVVKGQNNCGIGETSDTLRIIRNPIPEKPEKPIGNIELCQNSGEYIYTVNDINYATNIEWRINPVSAGEIIGEGQNITIKLAEDYYGLMRVSVRGINDCGSGFWSDDLIVDIKPLPDVTIGAFPVKCANGNAFTLSGGSPLGGYYMYNGNVVTEFNPSIVGVGNHSIKYYYTDANNCTNIAESDINVLAYPDKPEIKKSVIKEGEKYVYGKAGESLKIEIEEPELQYFWYNEPSLQNYINTGAYLNSVTLPNTLENINYWVKAYDGNCYSDVVKINTQSVIKPNKPNIVSKNIVCENENIQLIAIKDEAPNDEYIYKSRWYDEFMNIISEGDTLELNYDKEQRIYLSTIDSVNYGQDYIINESEKFDKLIEISKVDNPVVNMDDLYCSHDNIELFVSDYSNEIIWFNFNNEIIHQGNIYELSNVEENIILGVQAKNDMDCVSDIVPVNVNIQDVEAKFTSDVTNIELGSKVTFENQSKNAKYFKWNFGDGSDGSTFENPEHYYYEAGEFDVSLIIVSDIECRDTVLMGNYITVKGNTTGIDDFKDNINVIVYPNPFGNVVNVDNKDTKELNIRIYDVTGNIIYHEVRKDSKIVLDFNNKKSGIYFIEMQNGNNKIVKKIIKQ